MLIHRNTYSILFPYLLSNIYDKKLFITYYILPHKHKSFIYTVGILL